MAKGLLLKTDGTMSVVSLDNLDAYQKCVGGYIEPVTLHRHNGRPAALIVNEEGWLKNLPYNRLASAVATLFTSMTETIVGDALVVGHGGEEFDDIPDDLYRFLVTTASTSIAGA